MSAEVVKVEWEGNLVRQLEHLRGFPAATIVRNAARDFTLAAYRATPIAQPVPKQGLLALYDKPVRKATATQRAALARAKKRLRKVMGGRTGKSKFGARARMEALARVARLTEAINAPIARDAKVVRYLPWSARQSRYTRRVTWPRGWSRASWIGVMRDLGMQGGARRGKLSPVVERIGGAMQHTSEVEPAWDIADDIEFTARQGEGGRIIRAGLNRAADILRRAVQRAMKQQWQQ